MILENLKDLRRFAYSLTTNISDADDLTQIVVEKLLTRQIPNNVNPLSWMFRVCKNAWIDELRSRKVRTVDDTIEVSEIASTNDAYEESKETQQVQLKAAIMELPDVYREIITLVIISGLSYAETSDVLDIPIGTVMSRASRAREKLAAKFNKEQ